MCYHHDNIIISTTGRFLGVRVNDQRGGAGNQQRWIDHHQAQQWSAQSGQWGPHVAGAANPTPWPLSAAAQQVNFRAAHLIVKEIIFKT